MRLAGGIQWDESQGHLHLGALLRSGGDVKNGYINYKEYGSSHAARKALESYFRLSGMIPLEAFNG